MRAPLPFALPPLAVPARTAVYYWNHETDQHEVAAAAVTIERTREAAEAFADERVPPLFRRWVTEVETQPYQLVTRVRCTDAKLIGGELLVEEIEYDFVYHQILLSTLSPGGERPDPTLYKGMTQLVRSRRAHAGDFDDLFIDSHG